MVILLGEPDPPTHHEKEMKFSYSVFFSPVHIFKSPLGGEKNRKILSKDGKSRGPANKIKILHFNFLFQENKKELR